MREISKYNKASFQQSSIKPLFGGLNAFSRLFDTAATGRV